MNEGGINKMKNVLSVTIFLMLVFLMPAFASDTRETLLIDLGGGVTLEMVKLPKGFYIGKYEVTQGQWKKIMGSNPSNLDGGDNFPVENVSWDNICNTGGFLEKIKELKPSGYDGFRLSTEAEWEYACSAGTKTKFYFGDDPSNELIGHHVWYADNSGLSTHPVGQKKPNAFGLYDMSGNVSEWCSDNNDKPGAAADSGTIAAPERVTRGGTCESKIMNCRSVSRSVYNTDDCYSNVGFRLVLSGVR